MFHNVTQNFGIGVWIIPRNEQANMNLVENFVKKERSLQTEENPLYPSMLLKAKNDTFLSSAPF